MRARLDARTLAVRVPLLVVALLPLWLIARAPLSAALAAGAETVLDTTLRDGIATLTSEGAEIRLSWARPEDRAAIEARGLPSRAVPSQAIHVNTVVFLALALATPRLRWRQRVVMAAVGTAILYPADILTLVAAVRWQLVADFGYLGSGTVTERRTAMLYYWPRLFLVSIGTQVFPVAAWLTGLAIALRAPAPAVPVPSAGRNAPCPCGSGRKYKHCCGAPTTEAT